MIVLGILMIPFIGTSLGALAIFIVNKNLNKFWEKMMLALASGIMVAAAIWSLLLPALEVSSVSVIPVVVGMILGILFFYGLDFFILNKRDIDKTMLAITIHNIPEGMAVGVVLASYLVGNVKLASCGVLAMGIALQNFPEGFIVAFPLLKKGYSKRKAMMYGIVSGIFEFLGGVVTLFFTSFVVSLLPYFLSFAAGAMFFVVITELLPEAKSSKNEEVIFFTLGFLLMMVLDVLLG